MIRVVLYTDTQHTHIMTNSPHGMGRGRGGRIRMGRGREVGCWSLGVEVLDASCGGKK